MYNLKSANFVAEVSTKCGANCVMCPRDKFVHKLEDMQQDIFERVTDETHNFSVRALRLCGYGDPLCDRNLDKKVSYIKKKYPNIELSMITTAHLMQGEILELCCEYIDIIKISMYGFTKQSYEAVHRGSLKFEQIRDNIDKLLSRVKRPKIIMTFLDLPQNHGDMDAWREYYEPICERIDIWKPHNMGGGIRKSNDEIVSLPCRRIINLSNLVFLSNGDVSPCCFDFNRALIIGNIRTNSLQEIFDSDNVQLLQQSHLKKDISHLICNNCDQIRNRSDSLIYTNGHMVVGKNSMQMYD